MGNGGFRPRDDASGDGGAVPGHGVAATQRHDPLAFADSRMETAFCAYLGRGSEVLAQSLRGLQLLAWTLALAKWAFTQQGGTGGTHYATFTWALGCVATSFVVWAELASMRQLQAERRYARHELLKARNNLTMMVAKMVATTVLIRVTDVALNTPQARAIISGASLVFDRIRVSQALPLQVINIMCFAVMEAASWHAGAVRGELWRDCTRCLAFAVVVPLLALAVLEVLSRLRFLALHTHLPRPLALLPRPWGRLATGLRLLRAEDLAAAGPPAAGQSGAASSSAGGVPAELMQ